jgi:hypothetical protein
MNTPEIVNGLYPESYENDMYYHFQTPKEIKLAWTELVRRSQTNDLQARVSELEVMFKRLSAWIVKMSDLQTANIREIKRHLKLSIYPEE